MIRGNRIGEMCFSSQGTQFVKLAGTPWSSYHRCGSSGCFHQTTRLGTPFSLGGWEIQHQGVDELGVSLHAVSSSHGVRGKAAFWGLLRRQWPHTQGTLPSWPTRPQSLAFELSDDRNNQPVPLSSGSSRYCYKTPESRQLIDSRNPFSQGSGGRRLQIQTPSGLMSGRSLTEWTCVSVNFRKDKQSCTSPFTRTQILPVISCTIWTTVHSMRQTGQGAEELELTG